MLLLILFRSFPPEERFDARRKLKKTGKHDLPHGTPCTRIDVPEGLELFLYFLALIVMIHSHALFVKGIYDI